MTEASLSPAETPLLENMEPPTPAPEPVPRKHDHLAIALLIVLATAFFIDVLIGVGNFYMRDLTRYYYPTKQIVREIALSGEFPVWNRHFSGGQPMAANPEHEVFYPLTWLILLPSYDFGYRLHILIHIYIGLLGMYALLRSMELRPAAAFFGAFSFGLGGLYLSYINLLPILFCAAWLPLTCLYVRKFLLERRLRWFALGALFLGIQCLVGEPTTIMQTGFLLGMYALYRGWYDRPRVAKMLVNVGLIALISIAAFGVGAAQLLPAADHVADSARSRPFEFSLVSAWSMPWAKFAELIFPNILGYISIDRIMWYWGGGLYPGMGSPFLFSIYCGLLVTALAIAGGFIRARGARFVLILALFSSAIALGGHTVLMRALYDAGVATSIRYPEKFILIAVFAMILFAAQTLQRILDGDMAARDAALGLILATAIVASIVAVLTFTPYYEKIFTKTWGVAKSVNAKHLVKLSSYGWIVAAVRGAVAFLILWSVDKMRRRYWLALLGAFLCLDVLPVSHQLNPRMPSEFFTKPPAVEARFPKNREDFRLFHEADWYGQENPAKQYFSTGNAVYWVVRNGLYPMTPGGHRVRTVLERDYDKTALLPTIDLVDSVWDVKRSGRTDWWQPFVSMSNAWYRGIYKPFDAEKKRVGGKMQRAQSIQFLELEKSPRYYFADQLVTIRDRKDFVKKLSEENFSRRVAFIKGSSFVPADGVVHAYVERSNDATIDVESHGRGFLVMSITPHKYWNVTLDGREVEPVITNIGYQGIPVSAGKHRVEMRYRNPLIVTGALVSGACTLLLLGCALIGRRAPRIA